MMIARKFVSGALLAAIACMGFVGCAEDNDKNMMNAGGGPPPAGVTAPAGEFTPPPPGNDPEARKAYEMKRMQDSMKGYPGSSSRPK